MFSVFNFRKNKTGGLIFVFVDPIFYCESILSVFFYIIWLANVHVCSLLSVEWYSNTVCKFKMSEAQKRIAFRLPSQWVLTGDALNAQFDVHASISLIQHIQSFIHILKNKKKKKIPTWYMIANNSFKMM